MSQNQFPTWTANTDMTMDELAMELVMMVVRQTKARKIVEGAGDLSEVVRMVRAGVWPITDL